MLAVNPMLVVNPQQHGCLGSGPSSSLEVTFVCLFVCLFVCFWLVFSIRCRLRVRFGVWFARTSSKVNILVSFSFGCFYLLK